MRSFFQRRRRNISNARFKAGFRIVSDLVMETSVKAYDPSRFKEYLDWKSERTETVWQGLRFARVRTTQPISPCLLVVEVSLRRALRHSKSSLH